MVSKPTTYIRMPNHIPEVFACMCHRPLGGYISCLSIIRSLKNKSSQLKMR